jgi:hypothetical protein
MKCIATKGLYTATDKKEQVGAVPRRSGPSNGDRRGGVPLLSVFFSDAWRADPEKWLPGLQLFFLKEP